MKPTARISPTTHKEFKDKTTAPKPLLKTNLTQSQMRQSWFIRPQRLALAHAEAIASPRKEIFSSLVACHNFKSILFAQVETTLPEAYILPGVFGDQVELAELCQRLRGRLDFEVVALPGDGAPGPVLANMVKTASAVADEIEQRSPAGAIALAGYSFGASAALATAVQLIGRGRKIGWLGILDGPFAVEELSGLYAELRRATGIKGAAGRAAVDVARGTRRLVLSAASPASQSVRRALLTHLRNKALETWLPPSCGANGIHISTESYGQLNRARWAELCPNLWQVDVATRHEDLLKGKAFEDVVSALVQSLNSSSGANSPGFTGT